MILAATGHRPNKLGGYAEHLQRATRAYAMACLYELGPEWVLSGMADGWDMAVAEAAHTLGIPFTAVIPFEGQHLYWPYQTQNRYRDLLAKAAVVKVITKPKPTRQDKIVNAFHDRNEYMVDRCDKLLALWDGTAGGTGSCVAYAQKIDCPIYHVWDKFWMNSIPF